MRDGHLLHTVIR